MSEWRLIKEWPKRKMPVLYYCNSLAFRNAEGNEVSPHYPDLGRDEAFELGYFDGKGFCYAGTGHAVFEWEGDDVDTQKPTHWMPLPDPPKETSP